MTHKEFKLTVKNEILEDAGYERKAVHYQIGDVVTVDEVTFDTLQAGSIIQRYTQEGWFTFDKYDFENEVAVTTIAVDYSIRKLGQRKQK
jgi:translation initiation factor IF-1